MRQNLQRQARSSPCSASRWTARQRSHRRPPITSASSASFMQSLLDIAAAQQMQQQAKPFSGASVLVRGLTYHPPGTEAPLLSDINMDLPASSLSLVIGRSGSGKTTLLQLLAGLCQQTSGGVLFDQQGVLSGGSSLEERMQRVGLVFQFPERHFLGDTIANELSFAWPPSPERRWALSTRTQTVLSAVGLQTVPLQLPPYALSGGQQRRLALAVQLIRGPSLLLLDEPLAGLDWQSRAEVASLLAALKKECTLLVVSHDLQEIASLVDYAWEMKPGGTMAPAVWPPALNGEMMGRAWSRQQETRP